MRSSLTRGGAVCSCGVPMRGWRYELPSAPLIGGGFVSIVFLRKNESLDPALGSSPTRGRAPGYCCSPTAGGAAAGGAASGGAAAGASATGAAIAVLQQEVTGS